VEAELNAPKLRFKAG